MQAPVQALCLTWRWHTTRLYSCCARLLSYPALTLFKVFAGPMSESIPTSITSFAHRRSRADSTTSFTYFQESEQPDEWNADEAVVEESDDEASYGEWPEDDLESNQPRSSRQGSSRSSRISAENPLLRQDSSKTGSSGYGHGGRVTQKIYILTEDLTIVVAGFRTSVLGLAIYVFICGITLGLGYLLLRWLPKLRVRLMGSRTPLRECSWVVIEVISPSDRP